MSDHNEFLRNEDTEASYQDRLTLYRDHRALTGDLPEMLDGIC